MADLHLRYGRCCEPSITALIATKGGQVWPEWRPTGTEKRTANFKKCCLLTTAASRPTLHPYCLQTTIVNLVLWSALRQGLPFGTVGRLLESGRLKASS